MKYFEILTFLSVIATQLTVGNAQKKFNWKRVKPNIHKRLTLYGVVDVCGVSRGVEPCKYCFFYLFYIKSLFKSFFKQKY